MKMSLIISGLIMLCAAGGYAAAEDVKKPAEETLFKKAVAYYYQQKFEMAELMLQEELKTNPENALAYSYLGDIFLLKKRYDGAMDLYRKAVDLNPSSAEDHFRIGQIYYYKKDGKTAIEEFRRAFEINENIKYAYYHMGLSYLMLMRDKKQTIECWETYLRIAPEDPQHEKIRRVIELLKDPNFTIPPVGSEISIEEALHLGGAVLKETAHQTEDKKAGHEKKKTKDTMEDVYRDDALK
ncbi:MAG: tetratricopeptide repeat protein [Spirochaetes bacterium]|nr:MAG: tetratricopeptide repeat protein [Spirochaetota bacterium]